MTKTFSDNEEEKETYSVQLRMRRVTHEDAYVSVLVTDKVMQQNEDGSSILDWEKLVAEAIRISTTPGIDWQVENTQIKPHAQQAARPDDRKVVDSFYLPEA